MPSIFISYRRSDSQADTGRIYDRLAARFGKEAVFKDVDNIPAGVDFKKFLNSTLTVCKVVLAVIGPSWLRAADEKGARRLDDPTDWVRVEIEAALQRDDVIVVPLLVGQARMPRVEDLPNCLQGLAYRNSRDARPDPDFNQDMVRLINDLEQYLAPLPVGPQPLLEQYRQEVHLCMQEDDGELSVLSRSVLDSFRTTFGLKPEEATAIEAEELQPYKKKEEAIAQYSKVLADALSHENPLREVTRHQLKRLQDALKLSDDEIDGLEPPIIDGGGKPPTVSRKDLHECDSSKLLFLKNIRDPNGDWSYTLNRIQRIDVLPESRVFEIYWRLTGKGASTPSAGDLMILNQHARVTHIVEMLDDEVRTTDMGYFRWVRIVWMPQLKDWGKLPHQRDILGFEPPRFGGGAAYSFISPNFGKFHAAWDSLEAFQKHVFQQLAESTL